jgi:hypothetical protein
MMHRAFIPLLAGCAVFGTAIVLELMSAESGSAEFLRPAPRIETNPQTRTAPPPVDEMVATAAARPLFSSTRRPPSKTGANSGPDPDLNDVRLTGIVVQADRHLAVFAIAGAKPMVRSEGENVKEWRLESISPTEVSLSGPGGLRTLAPKADPNLVRPAPPVSAPAQPGGRGGQGPTPAQPNSAGAQPSPVTARAQPAPVNGVLGRPVAPPPAVRAPTPVPPQLRPSKAPRPGQ